MPLNKSRGNMYPWVTHTHSHLAGECPHRCSYCYVGRSRWGRPARYTGPIRAVEDEIRVNYGSGKTIFMEHMNDLWAAEVDDKFITAVLAHCRSYPLNCYVFQTKNPGRYLEFLEYLPPRRLLGCTIETNRNFPPEIVGKAPKPIERARAMCAIPGPSFVTIEPILEFDPFVLSVWLNLIGPNFVNIGADSKMSGLPEPGAEDIQAFVATIHHSIEIREKRNLERLLHPDSNYNRKARE